MIPKSCIGTMNPLVAPLHAALHGAARRVLPQHGSWRASLETRNIRNIVDSQRLNW